MYQLFISGYHLANVSQGKPYYVYTVEMIDSNSGLKHVTDKRYSEFNTLHRMVSNCISYFVFMDIFLKYFLRINVYIRFIKLINS